MPSRKAKGKGDGKNKGGKQFQQPPQASVAQQASSSTSQTPEKPETAQAEESWSYDYDTYWTDDWSTWESYYGYDGDTPKVIGTIASVGELTIAEDKRSEYFQNIPVHGQTDQNNRFCFSVVCLFRYLGHELMSIMTYMFLFVPLLYQCFQDLSRKSFQSIRLVEESIATDSGDKHPNEQHTCPLDSDITEECVYLNYDHGAQQALLCEYVDLGSHPTDMILDSGCTRAMGSRFAIDRLVQACQQHPKHDHIWFSKRPCSSKFSFARGDNPLSRRDL